MNVVILNSSPRKGGNSEILCEQFAKGAMEAGHPVQKIDLRTKKLSPCRACCGCANTHICVIQDDMAEILQAMIEADVIVLSSPVYFYSACAQIKMVIDRCFMNYMELKGKQFYYIITATDPQHEAADGTLAVFRGFACCLPDAAEKGVVYGTGTWDKGDVYKHPAYDRAYSMGRQI
ncbi:MAG: flavodoxin family protein [Lachnospiraceae bacterium]|nr:flavodoxin family protein [Lachnospiraceae bacterium]